jgi:hypothetical protein
MRGIKIASKKNKTKRSKRTIKKKIKTLRKYNKKNLTGGETPAERAEREARERAERLERRAQYEIPSEIPSEISSGIPSEEIIRAERKRRADILEALPKKRLREKPIIPIIDVDPNTINGAKGYRRHKQVTTENINSFVKDKIEFRPQVVNFAVGTYNHAILVDVQDENIMISDWNGDELIKSRNQKDNRNYRELIAALENKYGKHVLFYDVDTDLKTAADEVHESKGDAGGCSEYLFSWLDVYYREGYYKDPYLSM